MSFSHHWLVHEKCASYVPILCLRERDATVFQEQQFDRPSVEEGPVRTLCECKNTAHTGEALFQITPNVLESHKNN
jgi:hypothetical protein